MEIERDQAQHLMVVRWSGPEFLTLFEFEVGECAKAAKGCWKWLLDYRMHGGISGQSAKDRFRLSWPNIKCRFMEGAVIKAAVLLLPQFAGHFEELPDAAYQPRRGYDVKVFIDEGEARAWLEQQPTPAP